MAHNVESSSNKTTRKAPYPPQKPKTPDKQHKQQLPTYHSLNPILTRPLLCQHPTKAFYPPQSLGKRHHGHEDQDGARPPPSKLQTPEHLRTYTSQNHTPPRRAGNSTRVGYPNRQVSESVLSTWRGSAGMHTVLSRAEDGCTRPSTGSESSDLVPSNLSTFDESTTTHIMLMYNSQPFQ